MKINNLDLGQHFLINDDITNKIISYTAPEITDVILEIGGGEGAISKKIAPLCKRLDIIEIDNNLKPILSKKLSGFKNVNLIFDNALNIDFSKYDKVISSLPYNILEPFLKKIIYQRVKHIFILVGSKFGKSLYYENFKEKRSFCSLLAICFYNVNVYDNILKTNFNPEPKTSSVFVDFRFAPKEHFVKIRELFLMRELFEQHDKKIKNALIQGIINMHKMRGFDVTLKQSKEILNRNNYDTDILEKKIFELNNDQLNELYLALQNSLTFIPDKY